MRYLFLVIFCVSPGLVVVGLLDLVFGWTPVPWLAITLGFIGPPLGFLGMWVNDQTS